MLSGAVVTLATSGGRANSPVAAGGRYGGFAAVKKSQMGKDKKLGRWSRVGTDHQGGKL